MKLTDFNTLWRAVNKINIDIIGRTELLLFENEGIDTDLTDVLATNEGELFTILKNGEIRKTIIHICELRQYNGRYTLPKFHIFECSTITEMRNNKRGHRYKKASRADGSFWVIRGKDKSYASLNICNYNCLSQYNSVYLKNYSVQTFNLVDYMQEPIRHIGPYINVEADMTTIPASYSNDWSIISRERKEYYKWICQECFFDCCNIKSSLHTHHIDADKSNNTQENLKVLCIECHSNEFNHSHIKKTLGYQEFLKYKKGYRL